MLKYIAIICLSLHFAEPTPDDNEWNMLIFTQSWPESVCQSWTKLKPSHTCHMPKEEGLWTVHGIWPTRTGSMGPQFCNNSWLFNPEEIKPIEGVLDEYWTNIEAETSTYALWAHEWIKHGTCAAEVENIRGEVKYFGRGVQWSLLYGMADILDEANITPDDKEYLLQDFHNAVQSKLGVQPCVDCRHDGGKQYIQEIRICFDKNLQLTDCVCGGSNYYYSDYRGVSYCKPIQGIIYQKPPNKLYVQFYKLVAWLQWYTL